MSVVVTYKSNGTKQYFEDGVEITAEEFRKRHPPRGIEAGKPPIGHLPACWPMKSDALGVDPSRIAAASENLRKLGVPTEFDKHTGQAILTDRAHRKKLAQAIGVHDQSPKASWGDP